ncbi:hypothetical protein IW261DRAFT_1424449 [Armillaria novae-zelandiae]|uniref:PARP-type domain-containing protein n=1 Tax=Armillaria novae-zelandiae TaxID=153914 RepID=A0AA39NV76_9AGAR|nr:hypothetical protein IW261DRAFT_1424449 [Armillaria novae-zelandiae]
MTNLGKKRTGATAGKAKGIDGPATKKAPVDKNAGGRPKVGGKQPRSAVNVAEDGQHPVVKKTPVDTDAGGHPNVGGKQPRSLVNVAEDGQHPVVKKTPVDTDAGGHPNVGGKQPSTAVTDAEDPQNAAAKALVNSLNSEAENATKSLDSESEDEGTTSDLTELSSGSEQGDVDVDMNVHDADKVLEDDDGVGGEKPVTRLTLREQKLSRNQRRRLKRKRAAREVNSAAAKRANNARIKAMKHTLMIAEKPAIKVIMLEAPTKVEQKVQSQAASRKRKIMQEINDSLHLLYFVAKGSKHPVAEVGNIVPKCGAVMCNVSEPISAEKKNAIVYMRNSAGQWKTCKREPGQTANKAGQSSKLEERSTIQHLFYHWECVPPNTKVHLQLSELTRHESITDEVYDSIVKEIQVAVKVAREDRVPKKDRPSGEKAKRQSLLFNVTFVYIRFYLLTFTTFIFNVTFI